MRAARETLTMTPSDITAVDNLCELHLAAALAALGPDASPEAVLLWMVEADRALIEKWLGRLAVAQRYRVERIEPVPHTDAAAGEDCVELITRRLYEECRRAAPVEPGDGGR